MTTMNKADFVREKPREFKHFRFPSGGVVLLRSPYQSELRQFRHKNRKPDGSIDVNRLRYAEELLGALCVANPDDKTRMFSDEEILAGAWDHMYGVDIQALSTEVSRWTGYGSTEYEDIESMETAAKNSQETPADSETGA